MLIHLLSDPSLRNVHDPLLILFSGVVGGFTISNFPKRILNFFATPYGQFIAYFSILYIYYIDDQTVTLVDLIVESLLYVVIIQFIYRLLAKYET